MAEAFLQVLLENLSSLIQEEIGLILGVDEEMKKLRSTLTTIQAVLEDAEDKQVESRQIRDWLRKLNALVYEIDDIMDECNTEVSKRNQADSKLSRYNLKTILYRRKIARRVKQVTEKLNSVAAERSQFHLREMPVDRPREVAAWRETRSVLNESDKIYGREEDREKIVKMLVDDAREKEEMTVLPIIGVGGLGKTTLAQLVFNDPRLVGHFDKRIWVCVSDNFEIKSLVKAMIESANGKAPDLQHLNTLEGCLREVLSQKRYLVVLDDVWNEQQEKWSELKDILSCGSTGASILVTTRLRKVADIMGTLHLPAHYLKGLSDEHCWMLLRQCAFGQEEEEEKHPELKVIGEQIVKKCAGVPLAAKALGGILRFKRTEKQWTDVKESDLWKLSPEESLIVPALRLSYHHLPLEFRQCFAYFAAFPKDSEVEKEELIRLWMAHGFISSKGTIEVEDVGNEICDELLLRSLLQPSKHNRISMHDLVHDLAQSVMENKVPGVQTERSITSASTIRQVNLRQRNVFFPHTFQQDMDISSIMELKSLRVVDASEPRIKDLPPSIGNLKHLRYLNLSSSHIRTLPNSLCTLWNLEILNLDYCDWLEALPKNIRYLRNLQHLCLRNCKSLSAMPSKIRELTRLKTLSRFVVGLINRGNQLEELQCLNLISGSLAMRHLERVKDPMDAKKANIAEKKNLRHLSLWWERNSSSKLGVDVDEKVLEALEPHQDIEKLSIRGFSGRSFPLWMTGSTLGKVVEIEIRDCQNCRRLPNLGELPHLTELRLENVGVEYIIEDDEVGSGNPVNIQFPALELLELCDLPNLKVLSKEQESKVAFPKLKRLSIERCETMRCIPEGLLRHLTALQELRIEDCRNCRRLPKLGELPHLRKLMLWNVGVEYIIEDDEVGSGNPVKIQFLALEKLELERLPNLKGLSREQESKVAFPKLKRLRIESCETMRCILEGLLHHLTALQELRIYNCRNCRRLPNLGELPHLRELWLWNVGVEYIIEDDEIGSGNPEKMQFLALEELALVCLPNLKRLSKEQESIPEGLLRHLTALRRLDISFCPELVELPEEIKHLHNLQSVGLYYCPKVASIPALPNLNELHVRRGCPELVRRCERERGEDWHNIAHIPDLDINIR